jgi:hypothetical protein
VGYKKLSKLIVALMGMLQSGVVVIAEVKDSKTYDDFKKLQKQIEAELF